jgi:hypothetical protein
VVGSVLAPNPTRKVSQVPRGKKANVVPVVQWSIMIPIDLAFRIETELMDPVTKRPTYAARSKLIQSLLFEWLSKQGARAEAEVDTSTNKGL